MNELKPFCNSCGLCCAKVGNMVDEAKKLAALGISDQLTVAVSKFPFKYDEAGRCENLGPDNLCKVYATRPIVCSIPKIYENYYKKHYSRQKFYAMSEKECHRMQAEAVAVGPDLQENNK